jgi:hypothetical protein
MPFETKGIHALDGTLNLRVTADEKARLQEDASLAGLTMSEVVRRRYFGRPLLADADLVIIRELRRIGGWLQNTQADSESAHGEQTAAALAEVRACIQKLSHDR